MAIPRVHNRKSLVEGFHKIIFSCQVATLSPDYRLLLTTILDKIRKRFLENILRQIIFRMPPPQGNEYQNRLIQGCKSMLSNSRKILPYMRNLLFGSFNSKMLLWPQCEQSWIITVCAHSSVKTNKGSSCSRVLHLVSFISYFNAKFISSFVLFWFPSLDGQFLRFCHPTF